MTDFDASFRSTPPTGSGVGNREQLLDLTTVLSPRQAPVYGLLPKQAATADLVEWTVDDLRAPADVGTAPANAVIEGADVGTTGGDEFVGQFDNLSRLNNRLQHFRDTFRVSKKQEIMDSVTPVRIQEAEEKATSQVLRDIEAAICSDNGAVTGSGSVAGKLRGLGVWLDPTPFDSDPAGPQETDSVTEVPDAFKTQAGAVLDNSALELTEARFNGMLTSIFEETGEQQDMILVAGTQVRNSIIDGFTRVQAGTGSGGGNSTVFNQGDGMDVSYNVEIFQGPYGVVKIISANPKCLPDQKRAYLLDPSLLGWAEGLSMGSTMLEDQGGGPRGYIDAMGTLCVKGCNGLGKITDFAV